jgi:RHS repeat-associated protein
MYGVMTYASGLYYMRARYYHPEIRRFVNQDILLGEIFEGQTLNRYAYVTGRPVNYVDPFGLVGENVISTICGVALIEPTPVGEVACICALIAVGGLIVHSTSNTPTTTSRPFVAPGEGIEWPGDCNEDYLNHLQKQKGLLCDVPRRCHKRNETCQNVEAKMLAGYQCQAIRLKIMNECFRGGDENHRKELNRVNRVLSDCGVIAMKVCP